MAMKLVTYERLKQFKELLDEEVLSKKADKASAGSSTKPVYFVNGVPVATDYSLNADVPSDAKFTDTVYTLIPASVNTLGGVKISNTLTVSDDGVLSITDANIKTALGYTPADENVAGTKIKDDGAGNITLTNLSGTALNVEEN